MKKLTLALTLVLALLTALSTVAYAATAVRPSEAWNTSTKQFITTAVKVPATTDYEVYLAGTYQHKISVSDNKLQVEGPYRGLRPPKMTLPESDTTTKITLKMQLVKPLLYTAQSIGSDGLARVVQSGLLLPKNNQSIPTITIPVVRSTAAVDISDLKTLSLSLDLAGVADGVYGIQELLSDGTAAHQEGRYWDAVVVVIHNGTASLQVVETAYGWATTKGGKAVDGFSTHNISENTQAGKAIYGDYYPDKWYSSDWRLRVWNGN